MANNNWYEKVAQEMQEILLTYKPKQLNFKNASIIKKAALPILNLFLIALISVIICLIIFNFLIYIVIPAIFILAVIVIEIYLIYYWKPHLIEQEILQKLDYQKYYQIAARQILTDKFNFISFNNEFALLPSFFWPNNGVITTDNVLNLEYKSNVKVSFGTITQTLKSYRVEIDNKTRQLWNYHRYVFLTCELKHGKPLDEPIIIKLADTYKKALKLVGNDQVSEQQFELFFDVKLEKNDYNEILSKEAKSKLISALQEQQSKSVPIIAIDSKQITVCFQSKLLTCLYDSSFSLANFDLVSNQNRIIEDIIAKILQDFNWFNDTFKWIESLDLL